MMTLGCKAKFQTLLGEEDHSKRHFHCILDCGSNVVYLVIFSVSSTLSLNGSYTTSDFRCKSGLLEHFWQLVENC